MQNQINALKNVLIQEFFKLYEQHQDDHIYACTLAFNPYLSIDYIAVSTQRSIFAEDEDSAQYLAAHDRWNVSKWRYRSLLALSQDLAQFKLTSVNEVGHLNLDPSSIKITIKSESANHLSILLNAIQQTKFDLVQSYGIELDNILFFITVPTQPEIEIYSAQVLNPPSTQLDDFLKSKQPLKLDSLPKRMKLSQYDKDLLIDLAQIVEIQPYNYLHVANEVYLLSLEKSYASTNPYIQKLIDSIVAMTSDPKGTFAMDKEEILQRINQFYFNAKSSDEALSQDAIYKFTDLTPDKASV
ncbi:MULTISPECIES: DUF4303 domain-containing protein [unclassified Acinetobacter]|uniref:DUF4303 domain-containing protein n=1 Tax=unclassified Acinetobacter TaxID=196816 RepID=UPI000DD0158A|nr:MULTISPECIES: DUF4303 domain-containing protein [unclassified Acinetobacter]